jgi:DNA-binding transcriptional LysR family regulator
MERLETRELAYFVAVAEELHFGRAAARLEMAQPPLSRAIQQLERRLGVELLRRTSRRVSLTPAGEVLLAEARNALSAVDAAARRTRRADRLVVVMKPGTDGGRLPEVLAAYENQPEALPVEVLVCGVGEQPQLLREGRADVALVHGTQSDLAGLETDELFTEPQVVVLPRTHRLAGRDSVRLIELAREKQPHWPEIRDAGQLMQLVALGHVVAILPDSARRHLRQDLVCVPVVDAPRVAVLVAWPEDSRSPAVAAFVRTAAKVLAQ